MKRRNVRSSRPEEKVFYKHAANLQETPTSSPDQLKKHRLPLIAKRCVGDEGDINEHVSGPFDHSEVKVLVVNNTLLIPKSFIID